MLESLAGGARPLVEPTLLLVELAAAIARGVRGAAAAERIVQQVRELPYLTLVPLDEVVARQAASLAAKLRLRGADAVYAAVAERFGATLVTVDAEQLARCRGGIDAVSPREALDS